MSSNSLRAISSKWSIFFIYLSFLYSFIKFLLPKLFFITLLLLSCNNIKSKVFSFYFIWHFNFSLLCSMYFILLFANAYYLFNLHSNSSLLSSSFVYSWHFCWLALFNTSIYLWQSIKSFCAFCKANYIYFRWQSFFCKTPSTFWEYSNDYSVFYSNFLEHCINYFCKLLISLSFSSKISSYCFFTRFSHWLILFSKSPFLVIRPSFFIMKVESYLDSSIYLDWFNILWLFISSLYFDIQDSS